MDLKVSSLPSLPRADRGLARCLPTATVVLAGMIALLAVPVPGYAALTPALVLMAVYHWSIYRPDLLAPAGLFAVGLAQDLVTGTTVGAGALVLLLARAAVLRYRRLCVGRPFPFVWAGFALLAAAALFGLWALHCLLQLRLLELHPTLIRIVVTVALFPAASLALGRTQRALMGASG